MMVPNYRKVSCFDTFEQFGNQTLESDMQATFDHKFANDRNFSWCHSELDLVADCSFADI